MGARKTYRGPIHTLEQARLADMPVRITCEACGNFRQMHAFELTRKLSRNRRDTALNLWEPVPGFYCKFCKRGVRAIISAPLDALK
jgi:hypothetical protein